LRNDREVEMNCISVIHIFRLLFPRN